MTETKAKMGLDYAGHIVHLARLDHDAMCLVNEQGQGRTQTKSWLRVRVDRRRLTMAGIRGS
jgi:hypothetical protein